MEYADGGDLRKYLKKNFNNLAWDDKYRLAYELACAQTGPRVHIGRPGSGHSLAQTGSNAARSALSEASISTIGK